MGTVEQFEALVKAKYVAAGATLGGALGALPALSYTIVENAIGRPSSTSGLGFVVALAFGLFGACAGALLGFLVQLGLTRTRWSGRPSGYVMAVAVALLVIPFAVRDFTSAAASVRSDIAANTPRVIVTSDAIGRRGGASALQPRTDAVRLYSAVSTSTDVPVSLMWNNVPVTAERQGGVLIVRRGEEVVRAVDVRSFDYVREIVGVTARFGPEEREALVLLAGLRATGRRALLLIFDANGVLVHQELLERTVRLSDSAVLWRSGPNEGPSEVTVAIGAAVRYTAVQ